MLPAAIACSGVGWPQLSMHARCIRPTLTTGRPQATGWKKIPETINGRAAMMGGCAAGGCWGQGIRGLLRMRFARLEVKRAPPSSACLGRLLAAVTGFLAGAAAEVFGGGSILNQMAASPQSVVATIALIAVGSLVPIAKVGGVSQDRCWGCLCRCQELGRAEEGAACGGVRHSTSCLSPVPSPPPQGTKGDYLTSLQDTYA